MKNMLTLFGLSAITIALINVTGCISEAKQHQESSQTTIPMTRENQTPSVKDSPDTLSGIIKSYDEKTGIGCFYVDPEMVLAGVAKSLGDRANKGICVDEKYGKGVPMNFANVDPDADYPGAPPEDILQLFIGHWQTEYVAEHEDVPVFYVTAYEPFF